MSKSRQAKIRQYIKDGRYFEALGRTLETVQRGVETPTGSRKAARLLARLRDDATFLQQHYLVVPRKP